LSLFSALQLFLSSDWLAATSEKVARAKDELWSFAWLSRQTLWVKKQGVYFHFSLPSLGGTISQSHVLPLFRSAPLERRSPFSFTDRPTAQGGVFVRSMSALDSPSLAVRELSSSSEVQRPIQTSKPLFFPGLEICPLVTSPLG